MTTGQDNSDTLASIKGVLDGVVEKIPPIVSSLPADQVQEITRLISESNQSVLSQVSTILATS